MNEPYTDDWTEIRTVRYREEDGALLPMVQGHHSDYVVTISGFENYFLLMRFLLCTFLHCIKITFRL